nr:hypothetical protein [Arenimonas sp.]
AQGRVLALFQLAKLDTEHFLIILPSLDSQWLIQYFNQYKFRSKFNIRVVNQMHAEGQFCESDPTTSALASFAGDLDQGFAMQIPHTLANRVLRFTQALPENNSEALDQWHCADMSIGWLWIDSNLQNIWTPQMLSLQHLPALSLKKGCYPGQEIVARTHYLGKSKRHLQHISGLGLTNGQILLQNNQEIGKVVNANAHGNYAVAVLPIELNNDWPIQNNVNEVTIL